MDAEAVVFELLHKGIIADGDKNEITKNNNPTQQNQILHLALKEKCTDDALMTVCDIIIAVGGNRRMRTLGANMKRRLETSKCIVCACVCTRMCVLLHKHVCVWCVCIGRGVNSDRVNSF